MLQFVKRLFPNSLFLNYYRRTIQQTDSDLISKTFKITV